MMAGGQEEPSVVLFVWLFVYQIRLALLYLRLRTDAFLVT